MRTALLAGAGLIASSFSPVALPSLVGTAAAQATPNVLLCTNSQLLGGSGSGQYWGSPYLLPFNVILTTTFAGPYGSGATEYYVGTRKWQLAPLIQRCPVVGKNGQRTGKYQDVELNEASTFTDQFNCQPNPTPEGLRLGYKMCNFPDAAASSGDDR